MQPTLSQIVELFGNIFAQFVLTFRIEIRMGSSLLDDRFCRAMLCYLNGRPNWPFRFSALSFQGAKSPRTFVPWNFRSRGTFAPQTTFMPYNFRSRI